MPLGVDNDKPGLLGALSLKAPSVAMVVNDPSRQVGKPATKTAAGANAACFSADDPEDYHGIVSRSTDSRRT